MSNEAGVAIGGMFETGDLLGNLSSLTDDEFYRRLTNLRDQHKQTLQHYEKLYHEKLMAEHDGDIGLVFGQPLFSSVDRRLADDTEPPPASSSLCVTGVGLTTRSPSTTTRKTAAVQSTSSPPTTQSPVDTTPITRSKVADDDGIEAFTAQSPLILGRDYHLSVNQPVNTGGDTFNQSLEIVRRSSEKPPRSPCHVHKCKEAWTELDTDAHLSRGYLRTRSDSSDGENEYDARRYERQSDPALERIHTMWDDFSLNDYSRKNTSRALSTQSTERRNERPRSGEYRRRSSADSWRHRITMPEPFQMTLREEAKEPQKSRTMLEYEHKKAMEQLNERFECEKQFRATPVPSHIYLPLYEELMEKAESRRRTNVALAKEVLKSLDKPFQFSEKEKKKSVHERRHSASTVKHKKFKARPIPKSVTADVAERFLEEEEYRKIRIRMRSKELLRSSSLPPNMASRGQDFTVGKLKEKLHDEKKRSGRVRFQPRIRKKVPDFETIHRKQQKEAANRHRGRPDPPVATVCEPFRLRSSNIPSNIDRVLADIDRDEKELNENRWPYKTPRAKPKLGEIRRSLDTLPSYTSKGEELRRSKTYDHQKEVSSKDLQNEKNREQQAEQARRRRKELIEKAAANDKSLLLRISQEDKLKKFREGERARIEEYKQELAAMEERVRKQPFLFERTSQINAKKRVDKLFEDRLREAGVDEVSLEKTRTPTYRPVNGDSGPTHALYHQEGGDDDNDDDDDDDYHYSHSFIDDDSPTRAELSETEA